MGNICSSGFCSNIEKETRTIGTSTDLDIISQNDKIIIGKIPIKSKNKKLQTIFGNKDDFIQL